MPKLRVKLFEFKKKRRLLNNDLKKLNKIGVYRSIDSLFVEKTGGSHILNLLSYKKYQLRLRLNPIRQKLFVKVLKEEVFNEYVHLIKTKKIKEVEDIDLQKFLKNISIRLDYRIEKENIFKI
ncbi:MAG: hypothetical protein PHR26_01375 [Candidatus ainarchaeum sp.]|nr:hypothetical protein [Candidatus ainarchaeum sp.]MDD3976289.1 hypothetical protein [Candidatus ainarchaeum sp.]